MPLSFLFVHLDQPEIYDEYFQISSLLEKQTPCSLRGSQGENSCCQPSNQKPGKIKQEPGEIKATGESRAR